MKPNAIIERFDTDDRGVSPVIGVILMVAITVILAAVIGTFVLDLGQSAGNSAPSASLTVDVDTASDNVTISHKGGDALDSTQTRVLIDVEGTQSTLDATTDAEQVSFAVGDTATISVNDSAAGDTVDSIDWDSANNFEFSTSSNNIGGISSGDSVSIQIIDTNSQRVIFETELTA